MLNSFPDSLMDQPSLRRMTSCLGFARRQAKKNNVLEVIYPIDLALSFLVRKKCHLCDPPGPGRDIARKALFLDELIPPQCNLPGQVTCDVAVQTGDELLAIPLADMIAKNVRAHVSEATAQCKHDMAEQEQRLEELQAQIDQLQSTNKCSASCFASGAPTPGAAPSSAATAGVDQLSRAQSKQARREDRRRQLEQFCEESGGFSARCTLDPLASRSVALPVTHRARPLEDVLAFVS